MKKKSSKGITLILVAVLLVGAVLLAYPTVSDWWNSFHQSRAIASYAQQVAELDNDTYEKLWSQARSYNDALSGGVERFTLTEAQQTRYDALLDVSGTGIMGYIEIPKIKCDLPIYHGTGEAVLQIAVGHIAGTSLPVGGAGTHCVLSGHRGLPSAKLFTDLDKLEEGDTFMLRVLDETLTYEVDQIRTVLPQEVEELDMIKGEDLCTLITCTPYGINSHRLLVRGHRVENAATAASIRVTADAMQVEPLLVAPVMALPMLLLLFILLLLPKRKTKESGDMD